MKLIDVFVIFKLSVQSRFYSFGSVFYYSVFYVCLVCLSEFHSIWFIILSEELQNRLIKPDITSAITASESSLLSKSDSSLLQ